MKSHLIAIGCDHYDHLRLLSGAAADARSVFDVLTGVGQPYVAADSRLLLSPTKAELETNLRNLITLPIDVLTLYFAGHGGTKEGSYYFCLRDTQEELLSVTGYALSSWLNTVKELRPRYAYLIADSCFSGGSHHDIRDLLSDPRLGRHSASTFACLAAASADQYAVENNGGGIMTTELVKVFDGRLATGVEREELDLLEVARVVGQRLDDLKAGQRPVAWGLNLFGPGRLCRNPLYSKSGRSFHIPEIPMASALTARMRDQSDSLWAEYWSVAQGIDAVRIRNLVQSISGGEDVTPEDKSVFVFGMANAFVGRLEPRDTPWEVAEALGIFATMLLPHVRDDPTAAGVARELLLRKTRLELELITRTYDELGRNPRLFLDLRSVMGDFFYLPLRLTKLLATAANALTTAQVLSLPTDISVARNLVKQVVAGYPNALRAISDQQGPPVYVWLKLAQRFGWTEELEVVFGCLFNDLAGTGGRIARGDLEPRLACEYCLARGKDTAQVKQEWLANPSQLLAVLLLGACENGLDDTVDPFLEVLDHRNLNLYFPKDYRSFADKVMEEGMNRTHRVGQNLWTCADFRRLFAEDWQRHLSEDVFPANELEGSLVTIAALAYPDRVPLHLQREATGKTTIA